METTGQKRIDTVAEDIKKLIADISNGKPAPITEENMNSFLNNVKEAMIAWNTPPVKEKYNGVLRMSILGKPARQLWYDKYSPKETKEYDASNNLKFLYGHIIEHLLLYLTELAGHKVEDRQMKVKVDDVKGHIDAKVDGEICDVKSASPFSFKKFKSTLDTRMILVGKTQTIPVPFIYRGADIASPPTDSILHVRKKCNPYLTL